MNHKLYLYSLIIWGLIGVLTVTFGIFREGLFIPLTRLDGTIARIILVPIQIAYIIALSYLFFTKTEIDYTQKDL
ncbi:MAG: hypothetical protein GF383_13990 [Candidatus Lokiarchaeota archaeon]|nr:hypothetical protein [Candidatus Lokiarchaeota archaeon]MBD3342438.1 hypothetical protein [Candidatus Lokiarchaeota archaeon]